MDERLLPTVSTLRGNEVLRVVGPDGKRMLMPVDALLAMAERRFATRASEDQRMHDAWYAINELAARVLAIEEAEPEPDNANFLEALNALVARLANEVLPRLDALTARVTALEDAVRPKPTNPGKDK